MAAALPAQADGLGQITVEAIGMARGETPEGEQVRVAVSVDASIGGRRLNRVVWVVFGVTQVVGLSLAVAGTVLDGTGLEILRDIGLGVAQAGVIQKAIYEIAENFRLQKTHGKKYQAVIITSYAFDLAGLFASALGVAIGCSSDALERAKDIGLLIGWGFSAAGAGMKTGVNWYLEHRGE